jgi:hypothetical protein
MIWPCLCGRLIETITVETPDATVARLAARAPSSCLPVATVDITRPAVAD